MNLLKFLCAVLLLFFQVNELKANWNPSYLTLDTPEALDVLDNPDFESLEKEVCQFLKNSWCSQEKARLILELIAITKPLVCVEIGAFAGASTLPILAALDYNKEGHAYVIDSWSSEESVKGLPANEPNSLWWASLDMNAQKVQFNEVMTSWSLNSTFEELNMTSEEAVEYVDNINFLHLDGNFSEQGALLDSILYSAKVAPGGYILLSNTLVMIDGKATKMKALWPLFEHCDIVCELDQGNTLLFRKKISQ